MQQSFLDIRHISTGQISKCAYPEWAVGPEYVEQGRVALRMVLKQRDYCCSVRPQFNRPLFGALAVEQPSCQRIHLIAREALYTGARRRMKEELLAKRYVVFARFDKTLKYFSGERIFTLVQASQNLRGDFSAQLLLLRFTERFDFRTVQAAQNAQMFLRRHLVQIPLSLGRGYLD